MIFICATCAVETADLQTPPATCAICEDERQWVPATGQRWTTLAELRDDGTRIEVTEREPGLWSLHSVPDVGIGQHTMVVRTPAGSVLFDALGYLDDETVEVVRGFGPVLAVAASHPHMYGVQTEWAHALGDVPVLLTSGDRGWLRRPSPLVQHYDDRLEVTDGVTLHRVGGHFPGQAVLEWTGGADGRGVLLAGDAVAPNPDRRTVTFLRSYPNRIPLSGNVVRRIAASLDGLHFDRLYDNFGRCVPDDAKAVVQESADRYARWTDGEFDHLTW